MDNFSITLRDRPVNNARILEKGFQGGFIGGAGGAAIGGMVGWSFLKFVEKTVGMNIPAAQAIPLILRFAAKTGVPSAVVGSVMGAAYGMTKEDAPKAAPEPAAPIGLRVKTRNARKANDGEDEAWDSPNRKRALKKKKYWTAGQIAGTTLSWAFTVAFLAGVAKMIYEGNQRSEILKGRSSRLQDRISDLLGTATKGGGRTTADLRGIVKARAAAIEQAKNGIAKISGAIQKRQTPMTAAEYANLDALKNKLGRLLDPRSSVTNAKGEGRWITTDTGKHIQIKGGKITKGNIGQKNAPGGKGKSGGKSSPKPPARKAATKPPTPQKDVGGLVGKGGKKVAVKRQAQPKGAHWGKRAMGAALGVGGGSAGAWGGAAIGSAAGTALGAAVGSIIPGAGTAAGATAGRFIGGALGGHFGGSYGEQAGTAAAKKFGGKEAVKGAHMGSTAKSVFDVAHMGYGAAKSFKGRLSKPKPQAVGNSLGLRRFPTTNARSDSFARGYQVRHPKLGSYHNVALTPDQLETIRNELGEIGEGGSVKPMSDLTLTTKFNDLVEMMRRLY